MRLLRQTAIGLMLALFAQQAVWSQVPDWQAGIVKIQAKGLSAGTGIVIQLLPGKALIVTAAHVVEGDPNPKIKFRADREDREFSSTILNQQVGETRGFALLSVSNPPSGVRILPPQPSFSKPSEGTDVRVVGFPAALGGAFSVLPSAVTASVGVDLMIFPATDEGYSGGPILIDGRVAGMVYGKEGSLGKAVPAAMVNTYLETVQASPIAWRSPTPTPAPAAASPGGNRVNQKDGLTYVFIPPGEFAMGCSPGDSECRPEEKPAHRVRISRGFWLGQTEVTQTAYQKVMGSNPSHFMGAALPVEQVSWIDADKYCKAAGGRLPTEAEWEYAARAGSTADRYGDSAAIGWTNENSGGTSHPVKSKAANPWGLYDMLGNVWEWVQDWYDEKYYAGRPALDIDPNNQTAGQVRVMRGGAWRDRSAISRVGFRNKYRPDLNTWTIGLRCVLEVLP